MNYQNSYQQIKNLGAGSYGHCYLVKNIIDSKNYVAKKILLNQTSKTLSFQNEIEILKKLHNPFIVKYKQSFQSKQEIIIIMQYCQGGDLRTLIKKNKKQHKHFKQEKIGKWFMQICFGIQYLHENKIIHRDLKPQNIFLTANSSIKIGDFGISKIFKSNQYAKTIIGTYCFMSPQICHEEKYSYQSDIWALGCILFQLCNLVNPFEGKSFSELIYNIINNNMKEFVEGYSNDLKKVVYNILTLKKSERWGFRQIMNSNFIVSTLQQQYLKKVSSDKSIEESYDYIIMDQKNEIISEQIEIQLMSQKDIYPTILSISNFVEQIKANKHLEQLLKQGMVCSATFQELDMLQFNLSKK